MPANKQVFVLRIDKKLAFIDINGKVRTFEVAKEKKVFIPKTKGINFEPSSSIPSAELSLSPTEFKLLHWIRSLKGEYFSSEHAVRMLGVSVKSLRAALKALNEAKLVKTENFHGKGQRIIQKS